MKNKVLFVAIIVIALCCFAGCSKSGGFDAPSGDSVGDGVQTESGEDMDLSWITFTVDGQRIDVTFEDNVATRDLEAN